MPNASQRSRRRRPASIATVLCILLAIAAPAARAIAEPLIALADVDLGEVGRGLVRQSTISICNAGDGRLTFSNPGGSVVTGLGDGFTASTKDLEKLAAASLGAGECFRLTISFVGSTPGPHSATIRVWASTRSTRDTAVLRAVVTEPSPQLGGYDFGARQSSSAASSCTKNPVASYVSEVWLVNLGSGSLTVASIGLDGDGVGGAIRLDTSDGAPRIVRGDIIRAATANDTPRHAQRVIFAPDGERVYGATMVIGFTDGSTVRATITGIGIESHIGVEDSVSFGVVAAASLPARRTVSISADGTMPTTITGATLVGDAAFSIVGGTDALPVTLAPGQSHTFEIDVRRASEGMHTTTLVVTGDFSRCDDSTTTITAVLSGVGAAESSEAHTGALLVTPSITSDRATVRFSLDRTAVVRLEFLDALGGRVTLVDGETFDAGSHAVALDAAALASGHYTCRLTAGGRRTTSRLLIVR